MLNKNIRQLVFIFIGSFLTFSEAIAHQINVKINFDWMQSNRVFNEKLHIDKQVIFDTEANDYKIVMSSTKMDEKFPVTLALLVKGSKLNSTDLMLTFLLVEYGYNGK